MWNLDNLINKATQVDCGALTVEFFNDDVSQSALDTVLFLDDRTNAAAFNFVVQQTDIVAKVNVYPIKYRVYHTLYNSNVVTLADPFVITVIDPCDKPVSLTASTLAAQQFTITDNPKTYQVDAYTPDPAWCDITYTYSIDVVAGGSAVTFNDDASVRTFTFNYSADLDLCGLVSIDYTVTVTGEIGIS